MRQQSLESESTYAESEYTSSCCTYHQKARGFFGGQQRYASHLAVSSPHRTGSRLRASCEKHLAFSTNVTQKDPLPESIHLMHHAGIARSRLKLLPTKRTHVKESVRKTNGRRTVGGIRSNTLYSTTNGKREGDLDGNTSIIGLSSSYDILNMIFGPCDNCSNGFTKCLSKRC